MKLTIQGNNGEYFEVNTDTNSFGYTLSHYKPTKADNAKKSHNRSDTFHANLEQVASKLAYLNLIGNDVDTVVESLRNVETNVAKMLKEIKG